MQAKCRRSSGIILFSHDKRGTFHFEGGTGAKVAFGLFAASGVSVSNSKAETTNIQVTTSLCQCQPWPANHETYCRNVISIVSAGEESQIHFDAVLELGVLQPAESQARALVRCT